MQRTRFSIVALLVLALSVVISCDDDTDSSNDISSPQSDFEWSTSWSDVHAISRPLIGRETVMLPTLGAFDVVKVDTFGQEMWRQSFVERHFCATENIGSGYLAAGQLDTVSIVRFMSNNGEPQWMATLDSLYWINAIAHVLNGRAFVFGGMIVNNEAKIGVATITLGGRPERYVSVAETNIQNDIIVGAIGVSDGGALAYGYTFPEGNAEDVAGMIMRFNVDGTLAWSRDYAPSAWDNIRDAVELPGGDFLCVGDTKPDGRNSKAWILRISPDGDIVWQHSPVIGAAWDVAHGVVLGDSFAIVAGQSLAETDNGYFGWLCRYSFSGELEATRILESLSPITSAPPIAMSTTGDIYLLGYGASLNPNIILAKLRQPIFPNE